MYYNQEEIIKNISIGYVLKNKGFNFITESMNYKTKCIFHEDNTPSLSINKATGQFFCYGCGRFGDFINLLQKYNLKPFIEIIKDLNDNYYQKRYELNFEKSLKEEEKNEDLYEYKPKNKLIKKVKSDEEYEILEYISDYWENSLPLEIKDKYLLSKKDFSYEIYGGERTMNGYGFSENIIEEFKIGYSENNSKLFNLLIEKFSEETINKYLINNKYFGVFDKTKKPIFKNMITFPIVVDGKIEYFIGRQTEESPKNAFNTAKYKVQVGTKDFLYNERSFDEDIIFITEGITDCIKLEQYKYKSVCLITTHLKNNLQKIVIKKLKDKRVFIIFDNEINNSGNNGAENLNKVLKKNNINSTIITLPLKKGERKIDINKFINEYGITKFNKLISPYIL